MVKITEKQTKELMSKAKEFILNKRSLTKLFSLFASKYNFSEASVKNHYYKTLKKGQNNSKLQQQLGISTKLYADFCQEFSYSKKKELLYNILLGINNGESVAEVLFKMAGGNDRLAKIYKKRYYDLLKEDSLVLLDLISQIEKENNLKFYGKDKTLKGIEEKVNNSYQELIKSYVEEITKLKNKLLSLEIENEHLKKMVKNFMLDGRDYIKDIKVLKK